jgi:hypothetical protein
MVGGRYNNDVIYFREKFLRGRAQWGKFTKTCKYPGPPGNSAHSRVQRSTCRESGVRDRFVDRHRFDANRILP